jgi:hypothetical protein
MSAQVSYPAAARPLGPAFGSARQPFRRVLAPALVWVAYLLFYATTTFVAVGLPVALLVRLFG